MKNSSTPLLSGLRLLAFTLSVFFFLHPSVHAAEETDTDNPDTLVLSDTLDYDDKKRESIFTGNVILTRGPLTMHADKLVMSEDEQGFQYGIATVNESELVLVRQENPEKFEVIEGKGLRGEYDGKEETITMIDQAVVTRFVCGKPFDSIRGERVVFNQTNDTYHAYGGQQSAAPDGRVRSVAQPRAKSDAAAEECRQRSQTTN